MIWKNISIIQMKYTTFLKSLKKKATATTKIKNITKSIHLPPIFIHYIKKLFLFQEFYSISRFKFGFFKAAMKVSISSFVLYIAKEIRTVFLTPISSFRIFAQ